MITTKIITRLPYIPIWDVLIKPVSILQLTAIRNNIDRVYAKTTGNQQSLSKGCYTALQHGSPLVVGACRGSRKATIID